jgi:hypothetical protein
VASLWKSKWKRKREARDAKENNKFDDY